MQGRNQPRDEGARMARTKFSYQETLARESCSLEGELHQAGAASGLFCSGRHPLRLEKYTAHRRCSVSVTPTGLPFDFLLYRGFGKSPGQVQTQTMRHPQNWADRSAWGGQTKAHPASSPASVETRHGLWKAVATQDKRLPRKNLLPSRWCKFKSSLCLLRVARAFALQMPDQGYWKQSPCGKWNPACGKGKF